MPERKVLLQSWLQNDVGLSNFSLEIASGDASFRRYFRVTLEDGATRIAMDAPPDKEDCRPFIDVTKRLLKADVHVPAIYAENLQQGFLLLEDLGDELYLPNLSVESVNTHYEQALDTILQMQKSAEARDLPPYDEALLRREMALFSDWLLGEHLHLQLSESEQIQLSETYDLLVESALQQPNAFVHRDYHSRNLMVLSENSPGVIDYQDAVLGPVTYDLVSLLKDCYIAWPLQQIDSWALGYLAQAKEQQLVDENISEDEFLRWFDLMGAQRHLKAAGIFCRLNHRDGKPGYLADIPRTLEYILGIAQRRPELAFLSNLIQQKVLPGLK